MHMRKVFIIWMFLLASIWAQTTSIQPEPPNIGILKKTIKHYIRSGAYEQSLEQKYEEIKKFIEDHMELGKKYAVTMDIDETTLSNVEFELQYDFGFNGHIWKEWVEKSEAKAIPAALKFYKWAKAKGIAVFFITGRRAIADKLEDDPTYKNLIKEGFTNFDGLYLKPKTGKIKTVDYKSGARKEIMEKGYIIIANIGDQYSDLEGGYAVQHFKLPNPMYFVE